MIVLVLRKIIWATLGFVLGLCMGIAGIEAVRFGYSEIFGYSYRAMRGGYGGAFWSGIFTAYVGWKTAPSFSELAASSLLKAKCIWDSNWFRMLLAGSLVWFSLLMIAVWGMDLFGQYWDRRDWRKFWVLLFGPPIVGVLAAPLLSWAFYGTKNKEGTTKNLSRRDGHSE